MESQIRQHLRHTWHPFFGRFGRLRPIQKQAIPPIVEGQDILVGAPTASGKTEAVCAPLVERIFRHIEKSRQKRRQQNLRMIVISPTRALCRDLTRRLERPVTDCGLTIDVKTGDTSPIDYNDPPTVLVTTPESMDSLICRHPKILRDLFSVVLDELHLLDGTSRGDQLRCTLTRLDQIVDRQTQICGASATLPNADDLARRYLGADGRFIRAGGDSEEEQEAQRAIEADITRAPTMEEAAEAVYNVFEHGGDRKLIVFTNTRAQVEDLTAKLTDYETLRDRVWAHHGSLSRAERFRTEDNLRDHPAGICVATMTLEVGIDVGDVDRTILLGPPPNVQSLLQRIGRGNRGESTTRVTCLYDGHFEKIRTLHLLECASDGQLFNERQSFRPSVIGQQALSLTYQNPKGWISAKALYDRLPKDARGFWTRADCQKILDKMADGDFFHPMEGDRFAPDTEAAHQYEYGQLHSNIESDQEVEVVDALTRQVVGRVRFYDRHREKLHSGEDLALSLGGKKRKVVKYQDDQLVVRSEDGLEEAQFIANLPPRYSRGLAADFARFLNLQPRTMLLEEVDGSWLLFHFLGTMWGRVFERMLREGSYMKKRGTHGAFFFDLQKPLEAIDIEWPNTEAVREAVEDVFEYQTTGLARLLGSGAYAEWVPADLQARWVRDCLKPDQLVERLNQTTIQVGTLNDRL